MGVKDYREQCREQLYKQFVSVNALIEALAEAEEAEPSEIAGALLSAFEQRDSQFPKPAFGSIDTVRVMFRLECYNDSDYEEAMTNTFLTIAEGGDTEGNDAYGWLCDDLLPFLRANGFERPVYFPPWVPKQAADARGALLEEALSEHATSEKPLGQRERDTLLCVIAALLNELKIDPYNPPRGLPQDIKGWLNEVGADMDDGTISNVLKKIPEAIEKRGY